MSARAEHTVFKSSGSIGKTIDSFQAALGEPNNGNAPGPLLEGRRQINWDAGIVPFDMPGDFFNDRVPRGAVFTTPGSEFNVSNSDDPQDNRFDSLNDSYPDQFDTFSAPRLFTAFGSSKVDVHFFVSSTDIEAKVNGFGAIFTDVDLPTSTFIEFYDRHNTLLLRSYADTSPQGLSFLGAVFEERCIAWVRIQSGNVPVGADDDPENGVDIVVMDDLLYGEPIADVTQFSAAGNIQTEVDAFRQALGEPNNGNTPGALDTGRREINWDAGIVPFDMPSDFFNKTVTRGAEFRTKHNEFRVSNSADPADNEFDTINSSYPDQFTTFSSPRLFAPEGQNSLEVLFFISGTDIPATVNGFGAIFTDVDLHDRTQLEYFDEHHKLLLSEYVEPSPEGLSFFGAVFVKERIASVRITCGNAPIGPDESQHVDIVVIDDLLYGEPQVLDLGDAKIATIGFSNSIDGDQDVTEFFKHEQLFITVQDVDLSPDSASASVVAVLSQGAQRLFSTLEPIGTDLFGTTFPLSSWDPGEVKVLIAGSDNAANAQIIRDSTIFINEALSADSRVRRSEEDAEELLETGAMSIGSSDLELVEDNAGKQIVGLRFDEVNVPVGATILSAFVQFTTDEVSVGEAKLRITAEATGNALRFRPIDNNISSRIQVPFSVTWKPDPWEIVQEAGEAQRTPDLSVLIQEVINGEDWVEGNAIAILISGEGRRTAESVDGSRSQTPRLRIKYIE